MVSKLKCTVKQWLLGFIYKSLFPSYTFCNQYLHRSGLKVTQNEDEVYIEKSNYYKGYFNGRGQKHKPFENTFLEVLINISMTKSHIIKTDNTNCNNRIVFVQSLTQFDPNIKILIKNASIFSTNIK